MASLPLLRPSSSSPSLMHHHHPSSPSSFDRIKNHPYHHHHHHLSGYPLRLVMAPILRSTLLRVSSSSPRPNHHHPIIAASPSQTLTNTNISSPSPSCFLRHPNSTESSSSKKEFICRASSYKTSTEVVPAKDRILSAIAYLLPFFNGMNFGVFLFDRFPLFELAFDPFVPLFSFYKSIPGANFMAFLALCFGVVRDRGFSRYVRRNALQATMLDVLLALPSLVNIVFDSHKGLKFRLLEISYGLTFLVIVAGFLYAFGLSVLGRNPRFPFVSDAVDWQLSAVDRQF